jgi:hypothetical protein
VEISAQQCPEKNPTYKLNIRLGGPQNRFVRDGKKKIVLLPGLKARTFPMTASYFNTVRALDYIKFCCELSQSLQANAGTLYHNLNKTGNVRITIATVEKQLRIKYYVYLFLVTWRGNTFTAPYYIVICGLSGAIKVFHIIS